MGTLIKFVYYMVILILLIGSKSFSAPEVNYVENKLGMRMSWLISIDLLYFSSHEYDFACPFCD
jgi:hypothetical protein